MSEEQNSQPLTEMIESSLKALDEHRANQMGPDLQAIQSGDFTQATAKRFIFSIFAHIRRDESVINEYLPILKDLAMQHEGIRRILKKSATKKGKCPISARPAIRQMLSDIDRESSPVKTTSQKRSKREQRQTSDTEMETISQERSKTEQGQTSDTEHEDSIGIRDTFTGVIDKVLNLPYVSSGGPVVSDAIRSLQSSMRLVKRDLVACEIHGISQSNIPLDLTALMDEAKRYYRKSDLERSSHFLQLARIYTELGHESLLRFSLAQHCFSMGRQQFNVRRRDARPYLRAFFSLHSRIPTEGQRDLRWEFYNSLALYFGTYHIYVDVKESGASEIADRFYSNLLRALSVAASQRQFQPLGRCIVEIAVANSWVISDLINRMKTRGDATQALQTMANSLQAPRVFHTEPLQCLQLLARIDTSKIAAALSRQSLSTADERRLVATALLKFADGSSSPSHIILKDFARQASGDTKNTLAFSLLVEPFVLNSPRKESELKAELMAEILGFPIGTAPTEYFLGRATELASLFDRFSRSADPNVKGRYGYNIFDTIRLTRRWLVETLRGDFRELVLQFFRRIETYVTAEQAKLIRDTSLEIALVSDRALYSPTHTRITIEIRNVGEGTADGLELEVFPVEDKYEVEDRNRVCKIDILADKTPVQKEVFVQPLIDVNESLDLSAVLRYNTLKEKNKKAELAKDNRTVWLYPETQFVRVAQPYNIGEPATTWFYGRQNLLEGMADNLRMGAHHDTSMIVYGLKRAGKTSVVKRFIEHTLRKRGLNEAYIPIYADLLKDARAQDIRTDGDFLYFLMEIIAEALPYQVRQAQLSFNLPSFRNDFRSNAFGAFSFLLEEILEAIESCRLLIVLDEFSALQSRVKQSDRDESLTEEMFGFVSNTIQSTNQLTFIFTGTYILLEMMREHAFDLAKICTPHMVGFLDDTSARQLVVEPVMRDENEPEKGWLEYDPRVVTRIVTVTNCHPYLVQYLCMQLVKRMNRLKHNTVNLNDIVSIVDEVISRPMHEVPMLTLWNEFDAPQHKVLSVIAAKSSVVQSWVGVNEITDTFEELGHSTSLEDILTICFSLADAELLEKSISGETDSYRITIPLYQMWLKQNKPLMAVFGR